jgi:putative RNA 2'-phosphotransferase
MGIQARKHKQMARFLGYMLGRHPDEFGLVTDPSGFIPLSDVLKVLHEEGWRHIRRNHLVTLSHHLGEPVLEIASHLVRAVDRSRLEGPRATTDYPKLAYAPIRRRAYDTVLQHGLRPQGHTGQVVLFKEAHLARQVGRRKDAEPVIVTINIQKAVEGGSHFRQFGERILLAEALPSDCCRLPRPPRGQPCREQDPAPAPAVPKTPGSFTVTMDPVRDAPSRGKANHSKHRVRAWKKKRRQARRWKEGRDQHR